MQRRSQRAYKICNKKRTLVEPFIYPDIEGFWKGTAKKIGKGPECFSHDMKENYAAKKESWQKIEETYAEMVSELH